MNEHRTKRSGSTRRLVSDLRDGLDQSAVDAAWLGAHISPRQAKRLTQHISDILYMRKNPVHAVTDVNEQYIGEVSTTNEGSTWIGCRYGRQRPLPAAEFSNLEDATNFVGSDAPGNPAISAAYKMRLLFC